MADFDIDENITAALQEFGVKAKRIQNKALRGAAPTVASAIEAKAPYETTSDRSWKAQREMDKLKGKKTEFKHLKDDVVVSGIDQFGHINIGFGKDTYWRVHFVELGTVNFPAKPFISPAMEDSKESFMQTLQNNLREGLNL